MLHSSGNYVSDSHKDYDSIRHAELSRLTCHSFLAPVMMQLHIAGVIYFLYTFSLRRDRQMKRLSLLLTGVLLLAACGEEEATEPVEVEGTVEDTATSEPSQEELNTQLKEEATEIDFVQANAGEIEEGTKVKATGEVSNLVDDTLMEFTLTTEEGDGSGMYSVKGFNTTDAAIEEGQTVTVYGTYDGKDDSGMPSIALTIIE
jgi:hypothetical protein